MNREPDVKPVCYTKIIHELSLTYRISLHLLVAVQRLCEVELWVEDEDEAELGVVEPLHQFIRVYQPVHSEVLGQQPVCLYQFHSLVADV